MSNKVKFGLEKVHIAFKGVNQAISIEATGTPGTDGEVELSVAADTLLGSDSPQVVVVPLATETHDTLEKVASTMVNALNNDDIISGTFRAYREGATIYLETLVAQDNDSTLDITYTDTATTGATMGTASDVTEGTTGWGTPQEIEGAVNFSASAEGDETEFYADNMKYYIDETNDGYTGDLELAKIPDDIAAEMLGMTIDNNEMLVENVNDTKKEFALMAQMKGDDRNRRFVYYRCKAGRPDDEAATQEGSVDPQTDSIPLTMMQLEDGAVRAVIERTTENATTYDNFFDSVTLPTT